MMNVLYANSNASAFLRCMRVVLLNFIGKLAARGLRRYHLSAAATRGGRSLLGDAWQANFSTAFSIADGCKELFSPLHA